MRLTREIELKGRVLGEGKEPLVCMPLVGEDEAALARELDVITAKLPDIIEWRVDFLSAIGDAQRVLAAAGSIRARAKGIPILLTRRSIREGGRPIGISEEQVLELYKMVCHAGLVDLMDYELSCEAEHFKQAVALARETGVKLVASFHDFHKTPAEEEIIAKFRAMEAAGADIAKVAVMPQGMDDVLTLLKATLAAQACTGLPIVSMSMGAYGALSRLFGWAFGSCMTFAVGEQSSAPGQLPVEQLRTVLNIVQDAMGKA